MIIDGGSGRRAAVVPHARGIHIRFSVVMWALVTRATQTFAGVPGSARPARRYIHNTLDEHLTDTSDAVLIAAELFTNAITHSRSSLPGGLVRVSVDTSGTRVRVEITDHGPLPGHTPRLRSAGDIDAAFPPGRVDYGRGLQIVDELAAAWGVEACGPAVTVVWFELETGAGG